MFFSIPSSTFSEEGRIEEILDMWTYIEETELNLENLDEYSFKDTETKYAYNSLKNATNLLKAEIIRNHRKWNFDYYQIKWIVTNYKNFIYYSNKYFYFKKQKEIYPNSKSLDRTILSNFRYLKSYYLKVKILILKK